MRARGFTLVEMLIAVTILAVVGLMSWRGLDALVEARRRVTAEADDIERVVRTFEQVERDLAQRIPDALLGDFTGPRLALPGALALSVSDENVPRLRILRASPEAAAFWVELALENGVLARTAVPLSGAVQASDRIPLLNGVSRFDLRLLRTTGWTAVRDYLALGLGAGPVAALEISVERQPGERFVRVLPL